MVRFWDTSAVVPLLVNEPGTAGLRPVLAEDPGMAVWWATRVECISAMARRLREKQVTRETVKDGNRVIAALAREWTEVAPSEAVRKRAERLLTIHALRAADAFQLAAALIWSRDDTAGHAFVCLDDRLRDAAHREGFLVLPDQ